VKNSSDTSQDILFRPVWQPGQPHTDLFYAKPILRDGGGQEIFGKMPLARLPTVDATMQRQVTYLKQTFQALHMAFERGQRVRLLVRFHSLALATTEAATEVTDTMRSLSNDERRHIIPEIINFPKSLSLNTLDDITIPLMAFFGTWLAQPEKEQSSFTPFANLNYAGVILDLDDKPMDLKLAEKIIQLFVQRASHRRLPTWVLGIATPELARVARICGVYALSGAYMNMDSQTLGPALDGHQDFCV